MLTMPKIVLTVLFLITFRSLKTDILTWLTINTRQHNDERACPITEHARFDYCSFISLYFASHSGAIFENATGLNVSFFTTVCVDCPVTATVPSS